MEGFREMNKKYMEMSNCDIITNGKRFFVIDDYDWNGERFYNSFEIDKNLIDVINKDKKYVIEPKFEEKENGDLEIIDFIVEEI